MKALYKKLINNKYILPFLLCVSISGNVFSYVYKPYKLTEGKKAVQAANNNLENCKKKVEDYKKQVEQLNKKNKELDAQVLSIGTEKNELQNKIVSLENQNQSLNEDIIKSQSKQISEQSEGFDLGKTITSGKEKSVNKERVVYVTRTGDKYHRAGCRYLSRSCYEISLSEAGGYDPCSVCNP